MSKAAFNPEAGTGGLQAESCLILKTTGLVVCLF